MATVVLFDPYPISQSGFRLVLQSDAPDVLGLAVSSVGDLSALVSQRPVDLLILTVNTIKERNPVSLLEQCKRLCPDLPIVLYDEGHYPSYAEKWLKSGVSGYLLKSEPATVLLQCIDVVLNGGKYLSPEGWTRYLEPLKLAQSGNRGKLAAREFEVAKFLSRGKSVKWIAETLGKQPSTISNIKRRIFYKLKIENVIELNSVLAAVSDTGNRTMVRKLNLPPARASRSGAMR
jgi:DNA-binding NarL/FixJ family response regulator